MQQIRRLLPDIFSGLISGTSIMVGTTAYAALIFSKELSPALPQGLGILLFSAAILAIMMALTSSFKSVIAQPQDGPAAVLSVAAASLFAAMPNETFEIKVLSVLVIIALSTLVTGIIKLVLGLAHLGKLVRFIPFPVIGGFIAGSGLLFFKGSYTVLFGEFPNLFSNPSVILQSKSLLIWLPGLSFGIIVFLMMRFINHFAIIPIAMLVTILVVDLAVKQIGLTQLEAQNAHILLGPFANEGLWRPIVLQDFANLPWNTILAQYASIFTVAFISVIALLLNATGLELATKKDLELDKELKWAGISNIVASFGGAMAGYHSLSQSVLGHNIGAKTRLTGVVAGLVSLGGLLAGPSLLSILPKSLLGGLLLYMGLSFIAKWLYDSRYKVPLADYLVIVSIVVVIAIFGYIQGVFFGIILSTLIFVIKYSKLKAIKVSLTGKDMQSNVDRSPEVKKKLSEVGETISILRLEGFLFFGSANSLYEKVNLRLKDHRKKKLKYLIFDFKSVSGVDSSALSSFTKIKNLAEKSNFYVILSSLSEDLSDQLRQTELKQDLENNILWFEDLDHALEWCENSLTKDLQIATKVHLPLEEFLNNHFKGSFDVSRIDRYFEKKEINKGEYLAKQGEDSNTLFFVESGTITIELEMPGKKLRLKTASQGTLIGEMGIYLSEKRSASIIAMTDCKVASLSSTSLNTMQVIDAEAAAMFHKFIVQVLAQRVILSNRLLRSTLN